VSPNYPKQFVDLHVQRRLRQARITPVQQVGAQQMQSSDSPVEQGPDDRPGGRIPAQLVEVAMDLAVVCSLLIAQPVR